MRNKLRWTLAAFVSWLLTAIAPNEVVDAVRQKARTWKREKKQQDLYRLWLADGEEFAVRYCKIPLEERSAFWEWIHKEKRNHGSGITARSLLNMKRLIAEKEDRSYAPYDYREYYS